MSKYFLKKQYIEEYFVNKNRRYYNLYYHIIFWIASLRSQ